MREETVVILLKNYGISTWQDVYSTYQMNSQFSARALLQDLTTTFSLYQHLPDSITFEDLNDTQDAIILSLIEDTVAKHKANSVFLHKNDLHRNLDTQRGDLVYGTTESIDNALNELNNSQSDFHDSNASKINWYNVAVQEGIANAQSNFDWLFSPDKSRDVAAWSHFYRDQTVIAGNYNRVSLQQQLRYDRFTSELSVSKYTPIRALLEDEASPKLKREHGQSELDKRKWLAVRLACKFGIHFIANTGAKIHYLLDNIELTKIISKEPLTPGGNLPIITTELRFLYKHWDEYKDSVIFYEHGQQIQAPWEKHPIEWVTITSKKPKHVAHCAKKPVFLSIAAREATCTLSKQPAVRVSDNPSPEFGAYTNIPAWTPPLSPGRDTP